MTPRGRALLEALLIAGFCGLVLFARVYVEYPPLRLKLVTHPTTAQRGAVSVDVPHSPDLAAQTGPIAVIAAFENPGSGNLTINVAWNATNIGSVTLGPQDGARLDLTLPASATRRGDGRLRFKGGSGDWRLTYLEVANLHGSAHGIVNAVIVPWATQTPAVLAWPAILLVVVGLAWLAARAEGQWRWKAARVVHALAIALVLGLFTLALLSGLVSPYKVLLAWDTFWIGTAILLLHGIVRTVVELRRIAGTRWLGSTAAVDSIVLALIVAGFFTAVMVLRLTDHYKGNYSGFLHLNRQWIQSTPLLAGRDDIKETLLLGDQAYDGMFMYLMAFDPFLSAFKDDPEQYYRVVDTPPYRYTRIGYSLLTRLAAWNHPERYPQAMIWLILAAHFLACLALGAIIRHYGGHPAWALLYIFIPGFLPSLGSGLPESIAAAALLTGIWCLVRSQYAWAALCLAASLLVRETGVLFVAIAVLWLWIGRRGWRAGVIVGLAAAPLAAWRVFVTWRLFPVYGWESLLFMPGTSTTPFTGMIDLWRDIQAGTYYPGHPAMAAAGQIFPLVLIAALVVSLVLLWKRRDGLSAAAAAYSFLAVTHDYPHVWAHVASAERVTYDVFLLILVVFATLGRAREQRGLRVLVLAFFAFTIVYTVYFSFDAQIARAVLFSPTARIF